MISRNKEYIEEPGFFDNIWETISNWFYGAGSFIRNLIFTIGLIIVLIILVFISLPFLPQLPQLCISSVQYLFRKSGISRIYKANYDGPTEVEDNNMARELKQE